MEPLLSKQEKAQICNELFSDILTNILSTYEKEHQSSKEIPKPLSSIVPTKPIFLSDFAKAHNLSVLRTLDFYEKSPTKPFQLHHLEVHKQFVFNLCGYHTLYNLIQLCKLIKSQDLSMSPAELFNPANFWKFHFECTNSLDQHAHHHNYDRTKYPWTYYHIRWGDLERAYVKPLTLENKNFQALIASDKNFKISHMTFEFQFKRILYSNEGLNKMQKEISEFVSDKDVPVHNIKMIMMGITNHWFLFFVHRYMDHIEFWMLDSKNRDYLTWKQEDIDKYLETENERRKKEGKPIMNNWRIWVAQNAILDSQISTDLLVNCFLGNTTLRHFIADSEVKILSQGFIEMFLVNPEFKIEEALDDVSKRFEQKVHQKDDEYTLILNLTISYIEAYYEPLKMLFVEEKAKFLYSSNKTLLGEILSLLYTVLSHTNYNGDCWQANALRRSCAYSHIPIKFR